MADFIILDGGRRDLLSDFNKMKNRGIKNDALVEEVEQEIGNIPFYGNMKALMDDHPELELFKTRMYENFSRHSRNTLYIPELDTMIIRLPDKVVGTRQVKNKA